MKWVFSILCFSTLSFSAKIDTTTIAKTQETIRFIVPYENGFFIVTNEYSNGTTNTKIKLLNSSWVKTSEINYYDLLGYRSMESIYKASDTNFIVCGSSKNGKAYTMAFNKNGVIVNKNEFNGFYDGVAECITKHSDNYYLLTSIIEPSFFKYELYLALYNTKMELKTGGVRSYFKNSNYSFNIEKTIQLPDSSFFVLGWLDGTNQDVFIFKVSSDLDSIWFKKYGGIGNERIESAVLLPDTTVLLLGTTQSFQRSGESDNWVFKVDQNGKILNEKVFGGAIMDEITDAMLTSKNTVIFASCQSTLEWIKISEEINIVEIDQNLNVIAEVSLIKNGIVKNFVESNRNYYCVLSDHGNTPFYDWVVKLSTQTKITNKSFIPYKKENSEVNQSFTISGKTISEVNKKVSRILTTSSRH